MEDESDSSFNSDDAVLLSELLEEIFPPEKSVLTTPSEDPPSVTSPMKCSRNLQETSHNFNQDAEEKLDVAKNEVLDDNSDSSFYSEDAVLLSELIEEYKKRYPP